MGRIFYLGEDEMGIRFEETMRGKEVMIWFLTARGDGLGCPDRRFKSALLAIFNFSLLFPLQYERQTAVYRSNLTKTTRSWSDLLQNLLSDMSYLCSTRYKFCPIRCPPPPHHPLWSRSQII